MNHTILLIITHLLAGIVAIIMHSKIALKITNLVASDTAAVTQKIEAIKASDTAKYIALAAEWKAFVADGRKLETKIWFASKDLNEIIVNTRIFH